MIQHHASKQVVIKLSISIIYNPPQQNQTTCLIYEMVLNHV